MNKSEKYSEIILLGQMLQENEWADGSIQGYLSAKQTLRIIERIKARESPR